MHPVPKLVLPVEAAPSPRITTGYMVAVVREALPGGQTGRFAHDFIPLDDQPGAVHLLYDPLSSKERDRPLRGVLDRDVVDERMRLVQGQARSAVMVAELVQVSAKAREFEGLA